LDCAGEEYAICWLLEMKGTNNRDLTPWGFVRTDDSEERIASIIGVENLAK
jgi:hypothetical protein